MGGVVGVLAGCAAALHPPVDLAEIAPPRSELAGVSPAELEARAARAFAERTPAGVEEAAALWTQAAISQPREIRALTAAVRARIWLSESLEDGEERKREAVDAVRTAQWCDVRMPGSPVCAYWLGAALGVQAREQRSTALDALGKMERLFLQALAGAPNEAAGGPDRALASLYAQSPSWPSGPGDPDRAVDHALHAIALAPDHPPNYLVAADAFRRRGDKDRARAYLDQALEVARARLAAGDPDGPAWVREVEGARARASSPP